MEHPEMDMYSYEYYLADGKTPFCGVDEAGRGPLAGPVCAAAVILPEGCMIPGLDDSKKLTAKKRDALYDIIHKKKSIANQIMAADDEIPTDEMYFNELASMILNPDNDDGDMQD